MKSLVSRITDTDYTEDLALVKMIWEEKLLKQNIEFYNK